MIEIKNLIRDFGSLRAVNGISFAVGTGEIVGFLGPNGAGKTTTMRMMVGYLQPTQGIIELDGRSIFENPMATSARIGYLAEHNPLYNEMTVGEFLGYIGKLRSMNSVELSQRMQYVIQKCGLTTVVKQSIGTLSKGFRQRTGLAQAILHDPDVLIMDEPTSGLDPNQIIEIRELIRELGTHKTVILSSHIMQEVQALCDRVIIINKGKIVIDDLKDNLSSYMGSFNHLYLEIEAEEPDFSAFLADKEDVEIAGQTSAQGITKLEFLTPAELDLRRELSAYVVSQGWNLLSMYVEKQSLEEIFHVLTMESEEEEPEFEEVDESEEVAAETKLPDTENTEEDR
ncbi:MAG: ATP-binding cassette domain-containing protein [Candidatus Cloacimonadaceae bacterium]|nr:ATP-binding cassette domain-containing protein [Candidatus Cloacimonadaceae bacterium]MDP3114504.1 ATP-binding cassette domain-containing protein [Candidatus Cloacimonadaceae bacterium]